ncbi:MAG: TonB-dependent receptor [Bacteroidota bacterium]|nr:TonB-dependent receptor [Bacteroidota bacterium]
MKKLLLIISGIIITYLSSAQIVKNDSIHTLQGVNINSERYKFSNGLSVISLDTNILKNNQSSTVADLLTKNTTMFINSYGQGALACISLRGTLGDHTGIFWNGISLNTANIGSVDIALFPSAFFSTIEVQEGGASSLYGSGIIGGSIHLNNSPRFNHPLQFFLNSSYASFHEYANNYKISYGNRKLSVSTVIEMKTASNDFPFINKAEYGNPVEYQKNAALYNYGLMQDINYLINNNQLLTGSIWYQFSNKQIPAAMIASESKQYQIDESFKSIVLWKRTGNKDLTSARLGWINDYLNFIDEKISLNSKIRNKSITSEIEEKYSISDKTAINTGINCSDNTVITSNYSETRSEIRAGIFVSLLQELPIKDWKINISIRKEFIQNYYSPFSPSFGFEWKLTKILKLKGNISKNFKVPTLNDKFWVPGGNPSLNPETSINDEIGLVVSNPVHSQKHKFSSSLVFFNSSIENLIQWLPVTPEFWMPRNIGKVKNLGLELNANYKIALNKFNFNIISSYTFINSVNKTKTENNTEIFNKKMTNAPMHNFASYLRFSYKYFELFYNFNYTGLRYTTSDNSSFLPAYIIQATGISATLPFNKQSIKLQFDINNLGNVSYQTIQWYAMPGRNYILSISITI